VQWCAAPALPWCKRQRRQRRAAHAARPPRAARRRRTCPHAATQKDSHFPRSRGSWNCEARGDGTAAAAPSPSRRRRRRGRTCRAMVGRDPVLGHVDGGSVRPALAAARRNVVAPVNGDYGATKQKQRRVELSRLVLWWCRICVVEYDPFFVNSGRARAANLLRLGFVFHLVLSTSTTHVLIRRCSCDTTNGDYCYCLTMTTKERNIHRGVTAPTLYWT
jgi:hypothetical protein